MRATAEWVATHDDQKIPDRVKLRIWARCNGRCHITGKKIMPGEAYDFEHIKSLRNGGRHAEFNIALALKAPHREKTAAEAAAGAKADRIAKKHRGIWKPKSSMPGTKASGWKKKLDGSVERRS